MAYYDTINLVSGDDKPELNFTLRDSNTAATGKTLDEDDATTWAPIDLTGKTVRVHFRDLGGDTILDTITCGILAAADGTCYMQWTQTVSGISALKNLDAGTYEGEIELVYDYCSDPTYTTPSTCTGGSGVWHSTGHQTIFDKLKFKVRADFD